MGPLSDWVLWCVQCVVEKQLELQGKLQELCDGLTLTENRLIGHQQQTCGAERGTDLQQCQQEQQVSDSTPLLKPFSFQPFFLNNVSWSC